MDPNATQAIDPNRTQMVAGLNVTQTIQPVQCPICKTFNPAGEAFCVECGLLFASALPEDAFGAPAIRLPCLVDAQGREHFLKVGANIVGREGDVLLTDANVSRKHAEIHLRDGALFVRDLDSTNGTFVNDENLQADEERRLSEGDVVRFASAALTVRFPGDAGATQLVTSTETGTPERRHANVHVIVGEDSYTLYEGRNTLGRRMDNDIVLSDPYCSGAHALMECEGDEVYFTDLGSTNGSFLNGAKVVPEQRLAITPDDELVLGQTSLCIALSEKND